jgi:hypothetical protein
MRPRDPITREPLTEAQSLAGEGVGAWCSDSITGGGIWTPRGLLYWARMGMGTLDYKYQSPQFATKNMSRDYLYVYHPTTFELIGYYEWPYGAVYGCDIDADGRIYTQVQNAWKGGYYHVDPAIYVFEIKE